MVNMATNEIGIKDDIFNIEKWQVWFMTPFGLYETQSQAVERVKAADLDPDSTIVPVPVAISARYHEVVTR